MKVMQSKLHIITLLLTILFPLSVFSAGDKVDLMEQKWPFNGIFGRFDNTALQRGFKVYREVCAACHGIRHVSYRDLKDIGFSSDEIKSIAGEYEITDGPNDEKDGLDGVMRNICRSLHVCCRIELRGVCIKNDGTSGSLMWTEFVIGDTVECRSES